MAGRDGGGTIAKAELEWSLVRSVMWEAASMPHHAEGAILRSDFPGKENRVYREPVGVVALASALLNAGALGGALQRLGGFAVLVAESGVRGRLRDTATHAIPFARRNC